MKITIESTTQMTKVNGVDARVWEGVTESGIKVQCLITRVAVHKEQDCSQFEAELKECRPPTLNAFPARMIL